jgi:hypothetical protein
MNAQCSIASHLDFIATWNCEKIVQGTIFGRSGETDSHFQPKDQFQIVSGALFLANGPAAEEIHLKFFLLATRLHLES